MKQRREQWSTYKAQYFNITVCIWSSIYKLWVRYKAQKTENTQITWDAFVAQYFDWSIVLARPEWIHDGLYIKPNISSVAAAIREAQSLIWTAFVAQHSISTRMVYSYLLKQQLHKKPIIAKWTRYKAQRKKRKKKPQAKAQGLIGSVQRR